MCLNPNKTGENQKKPVETEEMGLTKRLERLKVNGGTVLRTRMNIDDYASKRGCGSLDFSGGRRRAGRATISERKKEQNTWQRE